MKKYTAVLLAALAILIAVVAHAASAADNVNSTTNICDVVGTNYKWGPHEQYPVIDLFGEKDVPLFTANGNIWNAHVNKFAKLIIDSNEPHSLKEGEKLDLGHGYALEVKHINIFDREAWLEFTKDGQYIADQIVSSINDSNTTWTVALDNVQGESNVVVMRVHVGGIGGLVEDNIVQSSGINIDGIWLIDYANAKTLKIGDEIGKFTLEKIVSGTNSSNLGSLVFKNITESPETSNVVGINYKCNSWSNEKYPLIDLFGEKDVPLLANKDPIWKCNVNKLSRLVLDSCNDYTLKNGEKLDLGRGYALKVRQIDADSEKVWLEFSRNGQHIADQNVSTNTDSSKTWNVVLENVQGENNIVVMKVHVNNLFVGAVDDVVRIDGIWLIDYANAKTLKIVDKIGKFTLEKIVSGTNSSNLGSLVFKNTTESPVTSNVVGTHYKCDSWSNERYYLGAQRVTVCQESSFMHQLLMHEMCYATEKMRIGPSDSHYRM